MGLNERYLDTRYGRCVMEWISVKNKLPDEQEEVYCTDGKVNFCAKLIDGEFSYSTAGEYNPIDGIFSDGDIPVTHWMEHISPPDEANDT